MNKKGLEKKMLGELIIWIGALIVLCGLAYYFGDKIIEQISNLIKLI